LYDKVLLHFPQLDLIDPVKDPIPSSVYSEEEDPLLYVSKKTGRGPLTADWLTQPQESVMCAYKKITVEFKYWGMQVQCGWIQNPVRL
jgi:hypothetical protein